MSQAVATWPPAQLHTNAVSSNSNVIGAATW
jgi:hypothetical protein